MAKLVNSEASIVDTMVTVERELPSPAELDKFLPWACKQLQIEKAIVVKKVVLHEFVRPAHSSKSGKEKKGKSNIVRHSDPDPTPVVKRKSKSEMPSPLDSAENTIVIEAFYLGDDLVHIKFDKGIPLIPREVIKIIALIAKFYPNLTKLSIHSGLSAGVIYEISSLVPMSRLTELIFDDCFVEEFNFHILLDKPVNLMLLSLARCQITDDVVRTMAEKLSFPKPASETLSVLNLSSNSITDLGASYIGQALRTNRHLKYLNLANNSITDDGAGYIFRSLYEFPLTRHEYLEVSCRYLKYAKVQNELIVNILADVKRSGEYDKYVNRKNSKKSVQSKISQFEKGKRPQKAAPTKTEALRVADVDEYFYAKAKETARGICGDFTDPFSRSDLFSKNGLLYSNGNNTLSYLNISFNELTLVSLRTILKVLTHQKNLNRMPLGLLNLRIDGNYMPVNCLELYEIDDMLESRLMLMVRSRSKTTKRNMSGKNK